MSIQINKPSIFIDEYKANVLIKEYKAIYSNWIDIRKMQNDAEYLRTLEAPIKKKCKTYKDKYKPKDYVQHIATGNIFEIKKVDESKYMPNVKQYWLQCKNNSEFPSYYSQEENLNVYFKKLNPKTVKVLYGW